jgi:hypothetical protein
MCTLLSDVSALTKHSFGDKFRTNEDKGWRDRGRLEQVGLADSNDRHIGSSDDISASDECALINEGTGP